MKELQIFNFENQQFRITDRDGNPWFVAKDVCDILGHTNPTVALQMLDDDEKMILTAESSPKLFLGLDHRVRELNVINESGLYNLIFRSNKPEAKRFRKLVTSEVLPSIRKKGFYAAPGKDFEEIEEWKKSHPYPFFLLDDAAKRLREMRVACDKGKMTTREWRQIALGKSSKPYTPNSQIKTFFEKNVVITGTMSDFVRITDIYALFEKISDLSQQKFTRGIKEFFPALAHKQKKIDGYPVLVFCGCRLKNIRAKKLNDS
jgi:prophage antirepressor-like protein